MNRSTMAAEETPPTESGRTMDASASAVTATRYAQAVRSRGSDEGPGGVHSYVVMESSV